MSATSSAATYVGRIGGLAVALGVGAAIASGTGVAWAETTDSTSSSSQSSSSQSSDDSSTSASKTDSPTKDAKDSTEHDAADSDDTDSEDTGSEDTGSEDAASEADDTENVDDEAESSDDPAEPAPENTKTRKNSTERDEPPATAAEPEAAEPKPDEPEASNADEAQTSATGTVEETTDTSTASQLSAPIAVEAAPTLDADAATTPEEPAATSTPARPRLVTRLLTALGVSPSATSTPTTPAQSPALLGLLEWVRREVERNMVPTTQTTATQTTATQTTAVSTLAAAAVVDPLPGSLSSTPVGWVTGQNNNLFLGLHWVPQTNNTSSFNIYGTDLGIMWDGGTINGERFVHLAFGDTFSGANMQNGWRNNVLLISYDDALENGLTLAPTGPAYQFIDRSAGQLGLFGSEVTVIPTSGIQIDGTQYVNYMSVKSWDTPGRWTTNYSAISQFYPGAGGGDWRVVGSSIRSASWFGSSTPYRPGNQNFQQMAYVLQPEDQVVDGEPRYLYAFGTPSGRAGSAFLSRVAEGDVTDVSAYEYWDGDRWVAGNAAVAAPIIGDSTRSAGLFGFVTDWANDPNLFGGYLGGLFGAKTGGNVSEMSVQYNEYLDKYVVLYGDGNNNIQMRVADTPEGAWSDPVQLASSVQYPGLYAPFIHPWSGTGLLVDDDDNADYNNLYWNMSIWGDYNVVLMETDLSPLQTVQL